MAELTYIIQSKLSGLEEERNADILQVLLVSLNKKEHTCKNMKAKPHVVHLLTNLYLDYICTDIMFKKSIMFKKCLCLKNQYLTYIPVKFSYVDFE